MLFPNLRKKGCSILHGRQLPPSASLCGAGYTKLVPPNPLPGRHVHVEKLIDRVFFLFFFLLRRPSQVVGNHMFNCFAFGVKTMSSPQGEMCGNDIQIPEGVDDVRVVCRG